MVFFKEGISNLKDFTTELIDTIKPQAKFFLKIAIEHYLILASFFAFLFSVVCYIRTTTYFEEWGINFFEYASFSDIYVVAFKAGIATIALKFTTVIILLVSISTIMLTTLFMSVSTPDNQRRNTPKIQLSLFLVVILMFLSTYLMSLSTGKLITSPSNIEQSPRVSIDLRWGSSLKCVSIIAGVSDYLFIWNFETGSPTALSRANVTKIEHNIEHHPLFIPAPSKDGSVKPPLRNGVRSPENQKDLNEWKSKLLNVCNQEVGKGENNVTTLPAQPIKQIGIK